MNNKDDYSIACTELSAHHATLLYQGSLTRAGALALDQQFNNCFRYYMYKSATIQIESPGGEVDALAYILRRMNYWSDFGVQIGTSSTFQCASAAALLLAMGTFGKRKVDSGIALLFHTSRLHSAQDSAMTAMQSSSISMALKSVDERMNTSLVNHLVKACGGDDALLDLMRHRLNHLDLHWNEIGLDVSAWASSDSDLRKPGWLKIIRRLTATAKDGSGFVRKFQDYLRVRFELDNPMDVREAFALCLIDEITGVIESKDEHGLLEISAETITPDYPNTTRECREMA